MASPAKRPYETGITRSIAEAHRGAMVPGGLILDEAASTLAVEPRIRVSRTDDHVERVARRA